MINQDQIRDHLYVVFSDLPDTGWICVRGIGEKGTPGEGRFMDDKHIDLSLGFDNLLAEVTRHVERWTASGHASFIVPGILKAPKGSSDNVASFHSIVVDLDAGDILAKHQYLESNLGKPTAVVFSGGTHDGVLKRHLYWTLAEPVTDISQAIKLRDEVSRKGGADMQFGLGVKSNPFGRAHQPVRIAGSVHGKNNVRNPVRIEMPEVPQTFYFEELSMSASMMSMQPWSPPIEAELQDAVADRNPIPFTQTIKAGGDGNTTRWSSFNQVAGYHINLARIGKATMEEAENLTRGWVASHMDPPWEEHRTRKEWADMVAVDRRNNGPMPAKLEVVYDPGLDIASWRVDSWVKGDKPSRKFLVEGYLQRGKHQMIAAEGGAGKTFLCLDLALKVAAWEPGDSYQWCGSRIVSGGTVVFLTFEDDKEELHIRIHDIDHQRLRDKAGARLIVIPTINAGGGFTVAVTDPKTGEARASNRWRDVVSQLEKIKDLSLVIIDTLNATLHGEENSAMVIGDFIRVAGDVINRTGAAMLYTHHIRKQGDEPISNAEEMKTSIRGSTAILGAMRVVLGIWHASDYQRRLELMGKAPDRGLLYRIAVVKGNNPELNRTERTLLRDHVGMLQDATELDRYSMAHNDERTAWLFQAIVMAAEAGHPYSNGERNARSGLYLRRAELPPMLARTGPVEFTKMVQALLEAGRIQACSGPGSKDKKWLDISHGPIASGGDYELADGAYDTPAWGEFVFSPKLGLVTNKSNYTDE